MRLPTIALLCLIASPALAKNHVQARHQAWVDKVGLVAASHQHRTITPHIKVDLSKLDGTIAKVGFRRQVTSFDNKGKLRHISKWLNEKHDRKYGNDYFGFDLGIGSDYGSTVIKGAFFVKTDKGTTYWIKAAGGKDFVFDRNAAKHIKDRLPYQMVPTDPDPARAVPTQARDGFGRYYNPFANK